MRNNRLAAPIYALLLAFGAMGATASWAVEIRPMVKTGFDGGGDTLVTVTFTNGETEEIKAHQGLYLGGGVSILNEARNFETEVSLSFKFDFIEGNNGNVDWTRFPLDVLVFYRMPKVRLGGGVTYHINPKVKGDGAASNVNLNFDNALGLVLQGDWIIWERNTLSMALGLRYTALEYELQNGAAKADANGLGLTFSVRF